MLEDAWEKSSEKDKSSKSKLGSFANAVLDCDWLLDGSALDCDWLPDAVALNCDWPEWDDLADFFGGFLDVSKLISWLSWDVDVTGGSSRRIKYFTWL